MRTQTINAAKYGRIKRQAEEQIALRGCDLEFPVWHKSRENQSQQTELLRDSVVYTSAVIDRLQNRNRRTR